MKLNPGMRYWVAMTILAFASVISFFHINSYFADKHHLNTVFIIAGIVFGLGAVYFLRKANEIQDN